MYMHTHHHIMAGFYSVGYSQTSQLSYRRVYTKNRVCCPGYRKAGSQCKRKLCIHNIIYCNTMLRAGVCMNLLHKMKCIQCGLEWTAGVDY